MAWIRLPSAQNGTHEMAPVAGKDRSLRHHRLIIGNGMLLTAIGNKHRTALLGIRFGSRALSSLPFWEWFFFADCLHLPGLPLILASVVSYLPFARRSPGVVIR